MSLGYEQLVPGVAKRYLDEPHLVKLFYFCFLVCSIHLPANEMVHTTKVRGFLYRAEDGRLILSKMPNLKSCCVGAAHLQDGQIIVEDYQGEPSAHHALLLEGVLHEEGGVSRLFNARKVEEPSFWGWMD